MNIEISADSLIRSLGLHTTDGTLVKQAQKIINNTRGFDKFAKHIISLNDFLQHVHGVVTLSNTKDYLKIKCKNDVSDAIVEEFNEKIINWANKYKVEVEKISNKQAYYIIGLNHE